MTYETDSYSRVNYSIGVKAETFEDPVDLSCKKVPSPSSPASSSESDKDSSRTSPFRGSAYLENQEETNNNDSKRQNSYHKQQTSASEEKNVEKVEISPSHTHNYRHESPEYSSSNHERKSPPYIMTPPSETSISPTKPKYSTNYDNACNLSGDGHPYPSYPVLPVALGGPPPVGVIAMPPVVGSIPATSLHHSQIPVPVIAQDQDKSSITSDEGKTKPRPFKAYPKDPMTISLGPDVIFDNDQKQAYCEFRNRMLDSVKRTNEGTNIKMRRISKSPMLPTSAVDDKDAAYWERRRKNNEAAKRSRDARRAKEDEIAIRAAFLEQEFLRLKYENSLLREENTKLTKLVYGA